MGHRFGRCAICTIAVTLACGGTAETRPAGNGGPSRPAGPPPAAVAVSIQRPSVTLRPGGSQQFTADVANATDRSVDWSVAESATGGSIDASGLYVAPASEGTFHVMAISRADTKASATATVTVKALPLVITGALAATVTFTNADFDLMAVDPSGTAYGLDLGRPDTELWSTADGRNWSRRGASDDGSFFVVTALSDDTLLADVQSRAGHAVARSTDHGVTWTKVLATAPYRSLTPHSFADLDGAVYFLEYQTFTTASTPIRLWKSLDRGTTWSIQTTFEGHRHGHGLMPDPARHALFAFFGDTDAQAGAYRSTDGGASWTAIKAGSQAGDIVDGVVLSDGSLLCGQDISYRGSTPDRPQVARIDLNGVETDYAALPSASYSTHAIASGGYVIGTTHEVGADVESAGWSNGSIWGSGDGMQWTQLLTIPQAQPNDYVRADVYWELSTGELVVSVRNAAGFGPDGRGYLLLRTSRQ
jgi:hypothetical protein